MLHTVLLDVTDGVATLTLNRPEAMNSFTDALEADLIAALDACDEDPAVRVVIITGAGRAFCAGMDLSDSSEAFAVWRRGESAPPGTTYDVAGEALPVRRDGGGHVTLRMFEMTKPLIVAVNGAAVGVGATMMLAADIRLAADDARFGFVFNRRGIVPESCSTWFLPRLVGMQTAMEWVLTGRVFGADVALSHGLVRSLHPPDELLAAAYALAREIVDNTAPVSAALARQMMWRMQGADHPVVAHTVETLAINSRGMSADVADGIAAFLEKRAPVFVDRVPDDVPDVFGPFPARRFDPHQLGRIGHSGGTR
ncbi:enoyl-CoA hydratase-related protein [Nocardioides pacificus]